MRPPLFAVRAAGFTFLRRIGGLAKAISKRQRCHLCIHGIMEACMGAGNVCYVAAWAKCVQNIPHIQFDGAFVV